MTDPIAPDTATELVVVGVDGGGSKTRVYVADDRAQVVFKATGEGSAVIPGAEGDSADVIAALVKNAVIDAELGHLMPRALVVGVAGVGREAQKVALQQELERLELADAVVVISDAEAAMEDAFADGPGILLIAGTGSIAWGRSPAGTVQRCGGWGPVIGDEGSGAWLGRKALQVIAAAHDGREPETALTGAVLTALELDDVPAIITWASSATPADMAELAPRFCPRPKSAICARTPSSRWPSRSWHCTFVRWPERCSLTSARPSPWRCTVVCSTGGDRCASVSSTV